MEKILLKLSVLALCMVVSIALLAGCGSGSNGSDEQGSADSTEVAEASETAGPEAESEEPVDPMEKFIGKWQMAAAKSQGVTMAGNFSQITGGEDSATLDIKEGGTGSLKLGEEKVSLTWEKKSDDAITVKPEKKTEEIGDSVKVSYKDDSLRMKIRQDDQEATAIFTRDGSYEGAKIIDMKDTEAVTSEDELIGKWTMSAMKLYGISVYGDVGALQEMNGGTDSSITFQKDGTAKTSSGEYPWKVDKEGASVTMTGLSGEVACPIRKSGDEIYIDMSKTFGDVEFIAVMSK